MTPSRHTLADAMHALASAIDRGDDETIAFLRPIVEAGCAEVLDAPGPRMVAP